MKLHTKIGKDQTFQSKWYMEMELINRIPVNIFVLINIATILLYSIYDYHSVNEKWEEFFILRILVAIIGFGSLILYHFNKLKSSQAFFIFLSSMNLFLVYVASQLNTIEQISSWNINTAFAGYIIPAFFITLKTYRYIIYNFVFSLLFLIFFFLFGSIEFSELLVNGGMFLMISATSTPLIVFTRYRYSKNKFKLRNELLTLNEKLKTTNAQLKESNATKNKLFSIIAHDLRSPFNALLGLFDVIEERINEGKIGEAKQHLLLMRKTSAQTYELLENLLYWSLIQKKKLKFSPNNTSLKTIIEKAINTLESNLFEKNISIKTAIIDFNVFVDEFMLQTIIRNLISNAIKFTGRNGAIEIKATQNKKDFIISVWDNGKGINESKLCQIFSDNNNLNSQGTEAEMGTGLGLSLCKEFVGFHHGKIWVESKENHWTRVSFSIPQ